MIAKERLEELIDRKATVWAVQCGEVAELLLVADKIPRGFVSYYKVKDSLLLYMFEETVLLAWHFEDLFETKEEVEWIQMYASRTIHFRPLMWKDIQDAVERIKNTKDNILIVPTQTFDNGSLMYGLYLCKSDDMYSIEITDSEDSEGVFKRFEFSEEGYAQAVEWARELFVGESDE